MFLNYLVSDPVYFLSWVVIMMFSVSVHELSHALAAYYEGDSTAKEKGYFTLNPLTHMGGASLVMLFLFGICWGACPVDSRRFRHLYGDALVSAAGPVSNLLLMVIFVCLAFMMAILPPSMGSSDTLDMLYMFFNLGAIVNATLFLLNMIPLPPLDGHTVLANFFPRLQPLYAQLGSRGFLILIALFWLPIGFSEFFWGSASALPRHLLSTLRALTL